MRPHYVQTHNEIAPPQCFHRHPVRTAQEFVSSPHEHKQRPARTNNSRARLLGRRARCLSSLMYAGCRGRPAGGLMSGEIVRVGAEVMKRGSY